MVKIKPCNLWTKEDKEKVKYNFNIKIIITSTLDIEEFFSVLHSNTGKEMWDALEINYKDITEVKGLEWTH